MLMRNVMMVIQTVVMVAVKDEKQNNIGSEQEEMEIIWTLEQDELVENLPTQPEMPVKLDEEMH